VIFFIAHIPFFGLKSIEVSPVGWSAKDTPLVGRLFQDALVGAEATRSAILLRDLVSAAGRRGRDVSEISESLRERGGIAQLGRWHWHGRVEIGGVFGSGKACKDLSSSYQHAIC